MRRRRPRPGADPPDGVQPADLAELEARFAAITAEDGAVRDERLLRRVRPLVDRRVPVRRVDAATGPGASRLLFADGTAVVVHGVLAGDVGVLASWVRAGSVPPAACSRSGDGVRLVFAPPRGRRRVSVVVTGLDQPA